MNNFVNCSNGQNATVSSALPEKDAADDYDASGALQYIVCTLVVYSVFGVFCTLLVRVRRSRKSGISIKDQDEAVDEYLKLERHLKFESNKRHMRNEIQRHVDSIVRFEEKLRLLEEARFQELEKHVSSMEAESTCSIKKDKQRKLSFSFFPRRQSARPSQKHRKFSLAENLHSQLGLSQLFVQAGASMHSDTSRSTLQDIDEEMETDIDNDFGKVQKTSMKAAEKEIGVMRTLKASFSAPALEVLSEINNEENGDAGDEHASLQADDVQEILVVDCSPSTVI